MTGLIKTSLVFILVIALVAAFFSMSGKSIGTYRSLDGDESIVSCRYYPFSKNCTDLRKVSLNRKEFFLIKSVKIDSFEEGSGLVLGWDKKNFCLTVDGEVLQIKSEQESLLCDSKAVFVGKKECYRQDYRDIVDYCD